MKRIWFCFMLYVLRSLFISRPVADYTFFFLIPKLETACTKTLEFVEYFEGTTKTYNVKRITYKFPLISLS